MYTKYIDYVINYYPNLCIFLTEGVEAESFEETAEITEVDLDHPTLGTIRIVLVTVTEDMMIIGLVLVVLIDTSLTEKGNK